MARYIYRGPVQHISIATGRSKGPDGAMRSTFKDVDLIPGAEPVELPADNRVVLGMIDAGQLTEADDATGKSTRTSKKGDN